ncbi:hypothetical protein MNBD_NITROSPINAE01-160 [hydrothermal vent metagenome]|uniref:Arginine/ornithine antiporter ArcD n=1 Tax=hydrothermal vent metagenome TaxID=652676 RepID=A0A3B1BMB6_9ZZZZ
MFEKMLWNSRFIVLFAVIASLISSVILFVWATADVAMIAVKVVKSFFTAGGDRLSSELHSYVVSHIITSVDDYLLATVLLIFAFGLYELFISKLDIAEEDEGSSRLLVIKDLDDLKDRLAKVVLMILIVTFFKNVMNIQFDEPIKILYLGAGIMMIGIALYLTKSGPKK